MGMHLNRLQYYNTEHCPSQTFEIIRATAVALLVLPQCRVCPTPLDWKIWGKPSADNEAHEVEGVQPTDVDQGTVDRTDVIEGDKLDEGHH